MPSASAECTLCEFIISYVEKAVGNNKTTAAVDAALDKVCTILPASLKPNCTSFVNKFGFPIAVLIAKNATPAEVCTTLKVCNGTQQIPSSNYHKRHLLCYSKCMLHFQHTMT